VIGSLSDVQHWCEVKSADRVVRRRLNKRGEIKLPAVMLKALGIQIGDEVILRLDAGVLVLRRDQSTA
jgi:bifunctional DNA-binding transcriptional regulator/antitoxin component of YhaV-PrlF toxin-antitoxin module